jgi:hypothetical protein
MQSFSPRHAFCALLLTSSSAFAADPQETHLYYGMVPGEYAVIGQEPDGGPAYRGHASIRFENGALSLVKTVNGISTRAIGKVTRTTLAKADVLRFTWPEHGATCLVRGDLDNYSRLTCYWTRNGVDHKAPGLEAYFPTATWPQAE